MTNQMLSQPWKRLVRMMQDLNFGRITFFVWSGEPDFARKVHSVQTIKLPAGDNSPRPESSSKDFELRKEVISLRDQLAKTVDGCRAAVEVKYGLPFTVEIEQEHLA